MHPLVSPRTPFAVKRPPFSPSHGRSRPSYLLLTIGRARPTSTCALKSCSPAGASSTRTCRAAQAGPRLPRAQQVRLAPLTTCKRRIMTDSCRPCSNHRPPRPPTASRPPPPPPPPPAHGPPAFLQAAPKAQPGDRPRPVAPARWRPRHDRLVRGERGGRDDLEEAGRDRQRRQARCRGARGASPSLSLVYVPLVDEQPSAH